MLRERGVLFKAPQTLAELQRINMGLFYGVTQVGKFITVYTRSTEEAVDLAGALHHLTVGEAAPAVPFEKEFSAGSNVFYRYGAFRDIVDEQGLLAMRAPDGSIVPDIRNSWPPHPEWVSDPFPGCDHSPIEKFRSRFLIFESLSQRGKGGVYRGLDIDSSPVRLCIVKEGRLNGETEWDGRDGC
ncbi:hypothetical protein ACFPAF_21135, partial [Hymenobacter endophyticus]